MRGARSSGSSARNSSKEGNQTLRLVSIATLLAAAGIACLNSSEPSAFRFQYQIGVYGCDTDCTAPGTTPVDSAARGDTIWLRHDIVLLQATDTVRRATIRPDCAGAVWVQSGAATLDTIPTATCPDSTTLRDFALGAPFTRFDQWIVDSALTPAVYSVVGRVLVQPLLEPRFAFTIQ